MCGRAFRADRGCCARLLRQHRVGLARDGAAMPGCNAAPSRRAASGCCGCRRTATRRCLVGERGWLRARSTKRCIEDGPIPFLLWPPYARLWGRETDGRRGAFERSWSPAHRVARRRRRARDGHLGRRRIGGGPSADSCACPADRGGGRGQSRCRRRGRRNVAGNGDMNLNRRPRASRCGCTSRRC